MRNRQRDVVRASGWSVLLWLAMLVAGHPCPRAAAAPILATWRSTPLAEVAAALGPLVGRPVVVDRRIDPTIPVTLQADGREAIEVLAELARLSGSELVVLRECVRLAVPGTGSALQAAEETRLAELQAAPTELRRRLAERSPAGWPAGSSPRSVVMELAAEAELPLHGLERLPHDHLRGLSLPAISRAATLDLLLAGFDLRAAMTKEGLALVPIDPQGMPRRPPRLSAETDRQRPGRPSTTRFTLEASAPLEQLLSAVATQTELGLRLDTEGLKRAGVDPRAIVRVQVTDVTRDQLLDQLITAQGLAWAIDGSTLVVTARSSPSSARRGDDGQPPD